MGRREPPGGLADGSGRDRAHISAHATHSAGAERRTIGVFRAAVATRADYVELDVRRTADGELVAFHDARTADGRPVSAVGHAQLCELAGYEVPTVAEVLAAIGADGRAKGHLDLKETGDEHDLVRLALDVLGPGEFIITTAQDASVAAIRARYPDAEEVPVALSLGLPARPGELGELRPLSRARACGADWVALDHRLAIAGVARRCRRRHVRVMVWTVNDERGIRYWVSRGRTDVLITDRPALAAVLREQFT